jgi:hypothetical protein
VKQQTTEKALDEGPTIPKTIVCRMVIDLVPLDLDQRRTDPLHDRPPLALSAPPAWAP